MLLKVWSLKKALMFPRSIGVVREIWFARLLALAVRAERNGARLPPTDTWLPYGARDKGAAKLIFGE